MLRLNLTDARIDSRFLAALHISPAETRGNVQVDLAIKRLNAIAREKIKGWRAYRIDPSDIGQKACIILLEISETGTFDPEMCNSTINFICGIINKLILNDLRTMSRSDTRERISIELKPIASQDPADAAEQQELLRLARQGYFDAVVPTKIRKLLLDFRGDSEVSG